MKEKNKQNGHMLNRRDFIRLSSAAVVSVSLPYTSGCSLFRPEHPVQPGNECLHPGFTISDATHAQVFESSKIGSIPMRNRIFRSATTMGMGDGNGLPTEELVKTYVELAEGGVGAIITGMACVQQNGAVPITTGLMIDSDEQIAAYRNVTETIHKYNTPLIMQVAHSGWQTRSAITGHPPVAPSAIKHPIFDEELPHALTESEIQEIITNFVKAIERAQRAGFDGVQLHGAHGYLLSGFLSPHMNQREDQWGGSLENRFRIVREIYGKSRKKVGAYPIMIKISAYDFADNGMRIEESVQIAKMLEDMGCDAIEVSCGAADGFSTMRAPEFPTDAVLKCTSKFKNANIITKTLLPFILPYAVPLRTPIDNFNVCAAQEIKQRVNIPVIVVGGIKRSNDIQQIISRGMADYVAMSRAFIIEPDIVNKFKDKLQAESECISCCYCLVCIEDNPVQCYYGQV
ncbi:MAG: NADH:flavin oxidoreductase [Desulfobacterales bacterium]